MHAISITLLFIGSGTATSRMARAATPSPLYTTADARDLLTPPPTSCPAACCPDSVSPRPAPPRPLLILAASTASYTPHSHSLLRPLQARGCKRFPAAANPRRPRHRLPRTQARPGPFPCAAPCHAPAPAAPAIHISLGPSACLHGGAPAAGRWRWTAQATPGGTPRTSTHARTLTPTSEWSIKGVWGPVVTFVPGGLVGDGLMGCGGLTRKG
jgi:hypothetical protein